MKRKGQSTEFRPPQQKTARVSRLNSRKSTTSGETSELQPTDRNQVGSQSLLYLQSASLIDSYGEHQPEIDHGLVKILVDVEQTNMNKTESAERNDIKNKPQGGITLDHEPKAAAAVEEMDNETEDTSSHELQTSHAAQSSPNNPCHRYSLDETEESILCGDVQENRIKVLDPKTIGVHLEGVSGAVGEKSCFDSETQETESLKPPAKKRLRRRMGMCGLGDRKRRFLLEGQHCKQVLSGGESLVAEAAGEKNKDNTEVGNEGTTMMDDRGATKQVLLEQLILQDVNKIQDEPSAVASELDIKLPAIAEPNLPGNGAIDGQDLEITMNLKGLLEEEGLRSNNKLTKGTFEVAQETTDSLVAEEASYDCIDVSNGVCQGPKETLECSVEVNEEGRLIGLANEVCDGSKETEKCPVAEQVSYGVTHEGCEGSKETSEYPVAEQVSYGVTRNVCEGSKETSEYPVAEQVSYGVTHDVCEGSKETSEYPVAEQVSYGVTCDICEGYKETSEYPVAEQVSYGVTHDVCEGSKETSEYPVAEQVSYGVTCDICEGYKETSEYPVAEQVSYGVTRDVCEGSKETSEYPVAEQVSYGVTCDVCEGSKETAEYSDAEQVSYGVTRGVCEGSMETSEYPVAEQVSYGVTHEGCEGSKEASEYPVSEQVRYGVAHDVCDGSKETSEYPVAEQVSYGVTNDICEGSKEKSEYPVAEQVSYGVTDEVCEVLTEVTQGPVAIYEAVIYESTSVTKEVCEDSNETTECPGAADVSSIAVTYEIREVWEGSEEITQGPVTVNEALRYGSTAVTQKETSEYAVAEQVSHGVTNDICEGSKETAKCLVAAKVISSPNCATGDIYKGSKEASEGPVDKALKVFYGSNSDGVCEGCKETTELPVNVGEEVNYGSSSVSDEVCGGSKAPDINQIEVSEEVSHGSIAVTNEVCDGFIDPTERPTEISEEVSCGFTGVNEVHEVTIPVSKEVQESRTALEKSEMEVEEQYPAVNYKHLVSPSLDLDATTELDLDGPQLSMSTGAKVDPVFMDHTVTVATTLPELAFSEICDAEDQCDDVEFPQTPTKAVLGSIGPSVEGGSNTEELRMPEAPPTNQEEHMHFYLGQDACDPLVTPAITQEPVSNPTLTPATEFPQDHDVVPSSLYSVTDSQLNSIALSLEVDDPPIPEAFLHQEDATELVCGLVKELSSLNRIVMAAHRETELLRRGNRPPKAQIRRDLAFTP
ncbi:uncharacterized protein si:ch211-286b5.2 [Pygocentrus nattereri]|uniref:uncharacterized protein si:ch211-286b5.2 n=1 Tax=Pygocentrus nattereri TaxID=42514 RepID=UPI001891315F|nr:uncharacterized protein si:ch211-286b5.2 [Pygocentrus nattereri]